MAEWNLDEAISWYRKQGAPADQTAVKELLKEVQRNFDGRIPSGAVDAMAEGLGVKPGFLLALIRRIPGLRLGNAHVLELCAGRNCGKHTALAEFAQNLKSENLTVRFIPCQRMCGKGPNIRFDGKRYNRADEELIRGLIENN